MRFLIISHALEVQFQYPDRYVCRAVSLNSSNNLTKPYPVTESQYMGSIPDFIIKATNYLKQHRAWHPCLLLSSYTPRSRRLLHLQQTPLNGALISKSSGTERASLHFLGMQTFFFSLLQYNTSTHIIYS